MNTFVKSVFVPVLVFGLSVGPLQAATITDTPLPLLNGATQARLVYTLTGVVDSTRIATSFHCSSTARSGGDDILWGVEVFENGVVQNDVTAGVGVATLNPGDTDIINTRSGPALNDGNGDLGGPEVQDGSARILATSPNIICTAFLVDTNDPPAFITTLPVFRGARQSGQ